MNHTHRSALSTAVLLALAVLVLAACRGGKTEVPGGSATNLDVPDITIEAYQGADVLGGQTVKLSDIVAQGKPVVLNFYAALCPPCRAEMPEFDRIYHARRNEVTLISIDIGPQQFLGSRDDGKALLDDLGVTYPAGTTFDEGVVRGFEVVAMPTTLFIRANGTVARSWSGLLTKDKMNELIDSLVEG